MTTNNQSTQDGEGEGNESQDDLTPEQIAKLAQDKKLAEEAKKFRLKLRDAEKQLADVIAERDALAEEKKAGSASDRKLEGEAATLRREIAELRKENKERREREAALEEKTRSKTIKSTLTSLVAKLNEPGAASELLEKKAKLAADDTVVFVVKDPDTGEMVEKEATLENIKAHKLLPEIFYPAQGAPGSGGRGGERIIKTGSGKGEVDLQRALTDFNYYRDNREAILAARRAQAAANR